jgi:hypothetical protein
MRLLFDMGKYGGGIVFAQRVCSTCLLNKLSTHRITGELVDSKIRINAAYSAEQRSAVRWIGENTPSQWSDAESLTVVLLLSLCPALA